MPANRAQDERLLARLEARSRGLSLRQLEIKFKVANPTVAVQTNDIMNADLAHCQKHHCAADLAEIQTAYWPRKQ